MFKKSVSLSLIVSQLGIASCMAAAPVSAAPSVSPEFTMLSNVIALQGKDLSNVANQKQLANVMNNYLSSAPKAGQQDRLAQAFVDLGVYTPAQAKTYVATAEADAEKVNSSDEMVAEISQLAKSVHPAGAQFSMTECSAGFWTGIVGVGVMIAGLSMRYDNPSCSTDEYDTYYTDSNGDTGIATTYGPTYCTQANYYPHRTEGDKLMLGGAVALAVGGLIYYLGSASGGC